MDSINYMVVHDDELYKRKFNLNAFRTIPASFLNSGIRPVQIPKVTKMGLIGYLYSFLMTKVFSFHK
mgnify:CR=1 FL=1